MYRFIYVFKGSKNASGQTFENKAVTKQLQFAIEYYSCRDSVAGGAIEFCMLRSCTWQVFITTTYRIDEGL